MSIRSAVYLVLLPVLASVSACTSQTMTLSEPALPEPLLNTIPMRIGVKYSPEMDDFTHREEMLANQEWTIHLGAANRKLFDQILKSMFDEVVVLEEHEDPAVAGVELLIRPTVDAFEFALPQQSRSETYTVWIRYRLLVYDANGKEIAKWPVSAYGKSEANRFKGEKAMQRAAALAMRDAAALVTMRFAKEIGLGKEISTDETDAVPTEQLAESSEAAVTRDTTAAADTNPEPKDDAATTENFTDDPG